MPFFILVAIFLSLSLLVETSSWCVRAYAGASNLGAFIARTNIYLYGGRFFAIGTQILIGYLVDLGALPIDTLLIFLFGFALASVVHIVVLAQSTLRLPFEKILLRVLFLKPQVEIKNTTHLLNRRLFLATAIVSTFFSIALMAPLVLAAAFPEYRLTLNNSGSLINFFGMLLLLAYLDPMLYKALDDGTFSEKIESYIWGRITGFVICAFILLIAILSVQ
jgi:hypothetical protein